VIAHEEIACPMGHATPHATSNTAMGSPTIHPETLDVLVVGAGISGCRHSRAAPQR